MRLSMEIVFHEPKTFLQFFSIVQLNQRFSNSGARPSRGRDKMLKEARMTLRNRYTYTILLIMVLS